MFLRVYLVRTPTRTWTQCQILLKVGLSPHPRKLFYLLQWKPFKNYEKWFLLHLKSSIVLKIFKFLSDHFGHVGKTKLISKLMTSKRGSQTITTKILYNISRSKGNQTKKFDQKIEYNKKNIFLQKSCGKWSRVSSSRTVFSYMR